ncbi:HpcH/HpaI aldolase/citrate lyase family protein [Cognatiyoonia sp. IB215446]|uniref:HpcH/HpaI aldolase family protein n=1 Tax=Cognatiyoonia sp. IB215446 TaxID=3097355 RepID=UPI002A179AA7|nr:HpcH/HpaI aldolase/citrate lyase family protein [Cognatiyoonia sp. IB215446]MDX8348813.1 HpcH/HpaI aldolase/citrate lyase family protein [Cognatiyoonia sp. IB215446]
MQVAENTLKTALKSGRVQHGLWLTSGSAVLAEIAGQAGFDWCLIDGEHGPNTLTEMLPQLQALALTGTQAVVRITNADVWMVKQVLDLGCQTVLVPMVDDAAKAEEMARAMRYPPDGIRGMGAVLARASGFGSIADYPHAANAQMCLLVQAESAKAVENIDAIAAVDGVDGVFVGPADLSADMGYPGQPDHPEVEKAIDHLIARTTKAGKIAGIITFDERRFAEYAKKGVTFLGVGGDLAILNSALRGLAGRVS